MQIESKRLRIFLVENHPDTRRWLTIYLTDQGHQVQGAGTMAEALAQLTTGGWDVLVSDIGLPDGNGWELIDQLAAKRPLCAIAMSGFGTLADQAKSERHGYSYHLLKPFLPEELDALMKCVGESSERTAP